MYYTRKIFALMLIVMISFAPLAVFAQADDPFGALVNDLLGDNGGWFNDNVFGDTIKSGCGFPNNYENNLQVTLYENDKLVFTLPTFEDGGKIVERYSVTALPVRDEDLNDYITDSDFDFAELDVLDEQIKVPTIASGRMTFSIDVTDSSDRTYLYVYPMDGDDKCEGIEDYSINSNDGPSNPSSAADAAADCLDDNCDDVIEWVTCSVNEKTLEATLRWRVTDNDVDEIEIFSKEHDDNNFDHEKDVEADKEEYTQDLPRKTSHLFLLRPVDRNGFKVGNEITYLCKFSTEPVEIPCQGSSCVGPTPQTWPEIALFLIFVITAWLYSVIRVRRK